MRKELCAAIGLAFCCLAASDVPQPQAMKSIENKREQAIAQARRVYQQAVLAAERQCVAEYQQAAQTAAKGGNIDLVAALAGAKKMAEKRLEEAQANINGRSFTIYADKDWQPTIDVKKGQKITAQAEGRWCGNVVEGLTATCGPEGMLPLGEHVEWWYLEASVAGGVPVRVNASKAWQADTSGQLCFRMGDSIHSDNSGSVTVRLTVQPE